MRNSTSDSAEIRWEILKSMLDNFPELLDRTEKYVLEKRGEARHELCFNDFPDQCEGCPEYREKYPDSTLPLVWVTGMGMVYPGQYKNVVVKECKLHQKRKVEFLK